MEMPLCKLDSVRAAFTDKRKPVHDRIEPAILIDEFAKQKDFIVLLAATACRGDCCGGRRRGCGLGGGCGRGYHLPVEIIGGEGAL